jgi:hypothetical protein
VGDHATDGEIDRFRIPQVKAKRLRDPGPEAVLQGPAVEQAGDEEMLTVHTDGGDRSEIVRR